jgi:hypothetical protein
MVGTGGRRLRPVPDPRDALSSLLVRKTRPFSRSRQSRSSGIHIPQARLFVSSRLESHKMMNSPAFLAFDMGALAVPRCLTLTALFSKMAKDSVGCD